MNPAIALELTADPTVNYAVQQNDVSVIKRLRVTNSGPADLEQVTLMVTAEPAFAYPWSYTLERIPAGATHDLGAIDLTLAHDFLATLAEGVKGNLQVTAQNTEGPLAEHRAPIQVLAYDQWNGTQAIPELLAAFVMPNHPYVERILKRAGTILGQWSGDPSFHGYQAKDPERVRLQAAAIFAAIQQAGISYVGVPASFEQEGQKIRTPDRILERRLGNCLDLATLFAACFEQAGLHPLICLTDGHAFPGVWLIDESFADAVLDDPLALRKRADVGEIALLEATLATEGHPNDPGAAMQAGAQHLNDPARFLFAVDVRRARMSRIRPLPVRVAPSEATGATIASLVGEPVTAPPAPELRRATPEAAQNAQAAPAPTRLDRWKRKLLDLSLRNRLLNFGETKTAVPLLFPDLPTLENGLAEGKQLEFHPRPQDWAGQSERDSEIHLRRTGEDAQKALLLDEFSHRRLRCDLEPAELTRRLTEIYRQARSSIEENGANTLYLALGMLVWYETKSSTQPRRAPILLIPIEMQRRSAQAGFSVRRRDEEAMVNVTLLEMLRHDFALTIDGLDPLPEDDAGIDVRRVLDRVRQAIKQIDRWDVVESAHIGLFSFTKFLMWRDLEVRTGDLQRSRLVSSLINFPEVPFPAAASFPDPHRLDEQYRPAETFTPVSADSSQLAAVYAAGENKSYVLHGPPGTGKSQTITNIIAHALAQNKTVLFVAEKMAALSVVQRRLEAVGLGPFCLELHSNKSRKADVLAQLEDALKFAHRREPEEWEGLTDRLEQSRSELNAYVDVVHRVRSTGESFFTGLARLIALGDGPRVALRPDLIAAATPADLARWRDEVRSLAAASRAAGHPAQHVWRAVGATEWTPQWRDQVDGAIATLDDALRRCAEQARQTAPRFGLPADGWSWLELAALQDLAGLLLSRTTYAPALLTAPDWAEAEALLTRWTEHGQERDRLRGELYGRYTEGVLLLDLDQLAARRATAAAQWFLPRWLTQRAVGKTLQAVARPGVRVDAVGMDRDILLARQLRAEEQVLAGAAEQARTLLGRLWREGEADWTDIADVRDWARSVRRVASRLAGDDVARARTLRQHWAELVAEQAETLSADPRLRDLMEAVAAVAHARDELSALLALVESPWGDDGPAYIDRVLGTLAAWRPQTGQLRLWCAWMKERGEAAELGLAPVITAYETEQVGVDQIEQLFERSFYRGWVDQIMGQEETLRRFSRQSLEERIARFRALDDQFSQLTQRVIQARLSGRIPRFEGEASQTSEVGILRRELQKRTRHMALRLLFQQIKNLLPRLKPCLLMSPISVAQYLDPAFPPFDLVVFDEASQVPTWDAVGAIARGAETIIVGDPKQLPPTNFFARSDDGLEEDVAAEDLESILDDCLALTMPEMHLRWHYRSRHESLIAFSNYHYYGSGLLSFPSPEDRSAVALRHVAGVYDRSRSRTNQVEAEALVAEVVQRLQGAEPGKPSLGIVTFSMAQQRLVEDLLDEARRRHPALEAHFSGELLEPVFVKNLENVQGDERDVILFSVCYGPDSQGKVSAHFGPLNRDGGQRRLNVAITRARREVVVFTSLRPEQIDLARTKAVGVHHLRSFLEFAGRGMSALRENVRFGFDSDAGLFEQHLYDVLTARGHKVQRNVGASAYKIDLAVEDPAQPGRFLLGIECDGRSYAGAATAREREKMREEVLRGQGWRLHRVWATDWWLEPERELERLEAAIGAAVVSAGDAAAEPVPPPVAPVVAAAPEPEPVVAPELPMYVVSAAAPSPAAVALDFYAPEAAAHIKRVALQIVEDEGPISLRWLCQRVAGFWGLGRVTSRVEERISGLLTGARRVAHGDGVFLWPAGLEPDRFEGFRLHGADDPARRSAEDLPPEEIANVALYVLQGQVSLPMEALVREVARLFGYQRIGQNVDRCVRAGVALLLERGAAAEQEGLVVIRPV